MSRQTIPEASQLELATPRYKKIVQSAENFLGENCEEIDKIALRMNDEKTVAQVSEKDKTRVRNFYTNFELLAEVLSISNSDDSEILRIQNKIKELCHTKAYSEINVLYLKFMHRDDQGNKEILKLADQNHTMAMFFAFQIYRDGRGDIEQNPNKSIEFCKGAAKLAHPQAINMLAGQQEESGDSAKAIAGYEKSAELGSRYAMHQVAWKYELGFGVNKDNARAALWYEKAADRGHKIAMISLPLMYQRNRIVIPSDLCSV